MNCLRLSGSARPDTCSARHVVPRMTNRSTPASTTVFHSCAVRCGDSAAATVTPAARTSAIRAATSSGWIGRLVDLLHPPGRLGVVEAGDLGEQRLGVLVARPQPLEVEHPQPAEAGPIAIAVAGDTTESIGAASTGISNR